MCAGKQASATQQDWQRDLMAQARACVRQQASQQAAVNRTVAVIRLPPETEQKQLEAGINRQLLEEHVARELPSATPTPVSPAPAAVPDQHPPAATMSGPQADVDTVMDSVPTSPAEEQRPKAVASEAPYWARRRERTIEETEPHSARDRGPERRPMCRVWEGWPRILL